MTLLCWARPGHFWTTTRKSLGPNFKTEQQSLIRTSKEGPPESEKVTACIKKIEAHVSINMLTLCTKAAHVKLTELSHILVGLHMQGKTGSATGQILVHPATLTQKG